MRRAFLRSPVAPVYYAPGPAVRGGIYGAAGSGDAIPDTVIYDFEDGNTNGWSNANGAALTAVQTTQNGGSAAEGTYCGEANINGANSFNIYSFSAISPTEMISYCRIENASSADGHNAQYTFRSSGNDVCRVLLDPSNSNVHVNGSDSGVTLQQDHWFEVIYRDIDWNNDTVGTVEIDGSAAMSDVGFVNTASSVDDIIMFGGENGGEYWAYSDYWAYST